MNSQQRISAFVRLGEELAQVASSVENPVWDVAIRQASYHNPWFTEENIRLALRGLSRMMVQDKLEQWLSAYPSLEDVPSPKNVGIIMAGNIPLVGFHDLMTVLITGNRAIIKSSSQDELLPRKVVESLTTIEPAFADAVEFADGRLQGFTHVIATGSSNSSRYFDHYFKKYPSIIRRNRNSVAVITGKESDDDLRALGKDIFRFFGLGCRNVSKLYVHKDVSLPSILDRFEGWQHIANHNKYHNNYDYHKAIFLVEKVPHLDTGFLLLTENAALACPVSVLHYQTFDDLSAVKKELSQKAEEIQCIVASAATGIAASVSFGRSQEPEAWEYADGADTVQFLLQSEDETIAK